MDRETIRLSKKCLTKLKKAHKDKALRRHYELKDVHLFMNSSYALVYTQVKDLQMFQGEVCHSDLSYNNDPDDIEPNAIIDLVHNRVLDESILWTYFNWVINESIYRDAFVTKDIDWVMKHGVIVRTDMPSCYITGALIALRMSGEFPEDIRDWYTFVQKGINPALALLFGHFVRWEGKITIESKHHSCFDPSWFTKEALRAYYRGIVPDLDLPPYTEERGYSPLSKALKGYTRNTDRRRGGFDDHIKKHFISRGNSKKGMFCEGRYTVYSRKELVIDLLKYQQTFIKEDDYGRY